MSQIRFLPFNCRLIFLLALVPWLGIGIISGSAKAQSAPAPSNPPAFDIRTVRMLDLPDGTHFNINPGIRIGRMQDVTYFQNGHNYTERTAEQLTQSHCYLSIASVSVQPRLIRPRRIATSPVDPESQNQDDRRSTGTYEDGNWVHFSDRNIKFLECKTFVDQGSQDVLVGAMRQQLGNWIQLDYTTVEMVRSFELETPWNRAFAKP